MRLHILAEPDSLIERLRTRLARAETVAEVTAGPALVEADTAIYVPGTLGRQGLPPGEARIRADLTGMGPLDRLIVVSSAMVHPPRHGHPGMVAEVRPGHIHISATARRWLALEKIAAEREGTRVTILRCAPVVYREGKDLFSRLLSRKPAITQPGHDPTVQLLHPDDFIEAVATILARGTTGLFNVAPKAVIPLRKATKAAGSLRIPVPRSIQWIGRSLLASLGRARPMEDQRALRYGFTVSGEKLARETGFAPRYTSEQTAAAIRGKKPLPVGAVDYDDHGFEKGYTDLLRKTTFKVLHDLYWRIEVSGLEHVPREGRAVLVGVHRGFMPFDGAMAMAQIVRAHGRYARFLIHPCLVKPAFQADFIRRIGGVIATAENADRLLAEEALLGIFPEGIQGAFRRYANAYALGNMGRDAYVKIALRNRAPLIPFATVGSAEIYPILGEIHWPWLKRYTEWPFLPITPTPFPLPSKWHTLYTEPIETAAYGPEAADDPAVVREIGAAVERRLIESLTWMRAARKNIFFGTIFDEGSPESVRA